MTLVTLIIALIFSLLTVLEMLLINADTAFSVLFALLFSLLLDMVLLIFIVNETLCLGVYLIYGF